MSRLSNKRAYYRIVFELKSALSIGAADSVETDSDAVLDSRGLPMIPASSLAGVYRSFFDPEDADRFFGRRPGDSAETMTESVVRVYDAVWMSGSNREIATRDNVALRDRVAIPGAKFDRQVVERGCRFRSFIEVRDTGECPVEGIERLLGALNSGSLVFGAKTTRGLGQVGLVSVSRKLFDFEEEDGLSAWLDFNMFDETSWRRCDELSIGNLPEPKRDGIEITLGLVQRGPISIREYSTEPNRPDFGQLYIRGQRDGEGGDFPVIPGTSWAGAFRERYERYSTESATNGLFGIVAKGSDGATVARKSRITFSESVVQSGAWKEVTRNSIDRFTGGTKDGALFTLRTYYAGRTELKVYVGLGQDVRPDEELAPLIATFSDLDNGFLAVGGLAAVGHGLFRIESAELAVCGNRYESFRDDLLSRKEGCPYSQPDVEAIARRVCALLPADYRVKQGGVDDE